MLTRLTKFWDPPQKCMFPSWCPPQKSNFLLSSLLVPLITATSVFCTLPASITRYWKPCQFTQFAPFPHPIHLLLYLPQCQQEQCSVYIFYKIDQSCHRFTVVFFSFTLLVIFIPMVVMRIQILHQSKPNLLRNTSMSHRISMSCIARWGPRFNCARSAPRTTKTSS